MQAALRRPCSEEASPLGMVVCHTGLLESQGLADRVPGRSATHTCEPRLGQAQSLLCTVACVAAGLTIPLHAAFLPLWLCYAVVTGTVAMGLWVLAHECGHGAFSDNRLLQVE